jgi:hypothetical protein
MGATNTCTFLNIFQGTQTYILMKMKLKMQSLLQVFSKLKNVMLRNTQLSINIPRVPEDHYIHCTFTCCRVAILNTFYWFSLIWSRRHTLWLFSVNIGERERERFAQIFTRIFSYIEGELGRLIIICTYFEYKNHD